MYTRKCGTCVHFFVKPIEVEVAQHAPHISACQPGMPHCLGGQVRGACALWQERAEKGMPMPLGMGPAIDSTFSCKLWKRGGPSVKQIGSFNTGNTVEQKKGITEHATSPLAIIAGIVALGAVKKITSSKEEEYKGDALFEQFDDFYYE